MILIVGSINMDILIKVEKIPVPGMTVLARSVQKSPGGKGANQAVAAAKLGADVKMIGCVGKDENGENMLHSLKNSGVDISHINKIKNISTSTAYIYVEKSGDNSIVVDSSANMMLKRETLLSNEELFKKAKYCVLQMEIPVSAIREAIELSKKHDVKIIMNPSPFDSFDKELLRGVDYLIPNELEASGLLGSEYDSISEDEWKSFMLKNNVKNMVITLGKIGCRVFEGKKQSVIVSTKDVNAVDTTGAGDTFLGAFVTYLSEGHHINEAAAFANKASSIEVTRYGAQIAMPTRAEVEA